MRFGSFLLWMVLFAATPAAAQVSIGIGMPNVSIGISFPVYPRLVLVPGYPVYYAPGVDSNYFFYDGMYWVYQGDNWYASSWYNGPWAYVDPQNVPLFVLRVPVRYYRRPPQYFHGWAADAPPRWGDHWGRDWTQHRGGWDQWNHHSAPAPSPLAAYQREFSGDRYPRPEQQRDLQRQHTHSEPRDAQVRQQYEAEPRRSAPPSAPRTQAPAQSNPRRDEDVRRPEAPRPPAQSNPRREENVRRPEAPHPSIPPEGQGARRPPQEDRGQDRR